MSEEYEKSWEFLVGDAKKRLQDLPDQSVHCVVTSPPYWGLRDYGEDGQVGLEGSPEEYVSNLCDVFDEVWRVLRDDGTLWLNIGDTYSRGNRKSVPTQRGDCAGEDDSEKYEFESPAASIGNHHQIKPKDLVGVPWRLAFALQRRGWYLRSDIIWAKGVSFCETYNGSCMPESVKDRPTNSHEHLFLFSKKEKYFYDHIGVREPVTEESIARSQRGRSDDHKWSDGPGDQTLANSMSQSLHPAGRNPRDVWTFNPAHYGDAHFAVMPEELVEPCIKAGTSEKGCCPECGSPYGRITERDDSQPNANTKDSTKGEKLQEMREQRSDNIGRKDGERRKVEGSTFNNNPRKRGSKTRHIGWETTCECGSNSLDKCTVLDPFAGAGTTNLVADRLGRKSIGIELNPEYVEIAGDRLVEHSRDHYAPYEEQYIPRQSDNELPDEMEFDELLGGGE